MRNTSVRPAGRSWTLIEQTPYTKELMTDDILLHDSDRRRGPGVGFRRRPPRLRRRPALRTELSDPQAERRGPGDSGQPLYDQWQVDLSAGYQLLRWAGSAEEFLRRDLRPPAPWAAHEAVLVGSDPAGRPGGNARWLAGCGERISNSTTSLPSLVGRGRSADRTGDPWRITPAALRH